MSGHSKWSTIKHKKEANDAKRGKAFSKVSAQLTHAAKQGGGDPLMNPTLRMYIDKAKEVGFPIENIEKAIKKGTGEGGDGVVFEEITYEGFGPGGMSIIVDTLTDNKNRTVSELRKMFEEVGGSMGEIGSVSWNFEVKGLIIIFAGHMEKSEKYGAEDIFVSDDIEEVMMNIMDIEGVMDIYDFDMDGKKALEIYTEYSKLGSVRDRISELGYVLKEANLVKEAKLEKTFVGDSLQKAQDAIERFEDHNDVQEVWTDANLEED
jgi:YebC/PmpR family DNA-binding regulatory protein